jgi:aspartate aminotransferase
MYGPSEIVRKLSGGERARQIAAKPVDLIDLSVGDPDFGSPPNVRSAAKAAVDEGYVYYAPAMGDPELRKAVAAYLEDEYGRSYRPDEVFITHGGTGAIYAVMSAYLNAGDEVIMFDPALSIFTQVADMIGAKAVLVPTGPDFALDMAALERSATLSSRMLVIVNPANPSGTVYTREQMDALVAFAVRHDLLILSDETYEYVIYDGRKHVSAADYDDVVDRTILLNTVSKTFSMTGWRVGYIAGREELIRGPALVHRAAMGPINSVAQRAALAAYTQTLKSDWQGWMLEEFTRRRDLMVSLIKEQPGLDCVMPEGAIYLMVRVDVPMSMGEFEVFCLKRGVGVRSGSEFGPAGAGHVRLSFASHPSKYAEGIRRLGEAVAACRQLQSVA